MERVLLRPEEAAEALGISRTTAYELIRKNELPSIKIGRSRRVPVDGMLAWLHRQREQAGEVIRTADQTGSCNELGGGREQPSRVQNTPQ